MLASVSLLSISVMGGPISQDGDPVGYRVEAESTETVEVTASWAADDGKPGQPCKKVTNNHKEYDLWVPYRTKSEWDQFVDADASNNNFSLSGCIRSCREVQVQSDNPNALSSGLYEIDPYDQEETFKAYCDMETEVDGWKGGWTLVAYAGKIDENKKTTTGMSDGQWLPLFFEWGGYPTIDLDDLSETPAFSKFGLFKSFADEDDQFMVRHTKSQDCRWENPNPVDSSRWKWKCTDPTPAYSRNNTIIFPVKDPSWFGRTEEEAFGEGDKMTEDFVNDGVQLEYMWMYSEDPEAAPDTEIRGRFVKKINNVFWSGNGLNGLYPGLNWNVPFGENCDVNSCYDGVGTHGEKNMSKELNRRNILYFDSSDSWNISPKVSGDKMWFWARPLSLKASADGFNQIQDIEIYYREFDPANDEQ